MHSVDARVEPARALRRPTLVLVSSLTHDCGSGSKAEFDVASNLTRSSPSIARFWPAAAVIGGLGLTIVWIAILGYGLVGLL